MFYDSCSTQLSVPGTPLHPVPWGHVSPRCSANTHGAHRGAELHASTSSLLPTWLPARAHQGALCDSSNACQNLLTPGGSGKWQPCAAEWVPSQGTRPEDSSGGGVVLCKNPSSSLQLVWAASAGIQRTFLKCLCNHK